MNNRKTNQKGTKTPLSWYIIGAAMKLAELIKVDWLEQDTAKTNTSNNNRAFR